MAPKEMRIIIPSRRRLGKCRHAFLLVPSATVLVAESEAGDYREFGKSLHTHPDSIAGIGALDRWSLKHYQEKCIVFFDDDITRVICLVGRRRRIITDPASIYVLIHNTATIAESIGISLFSFALNANILSFNPHDPFDLTKAVGPCLGFIGRRILPDPRLGQRDTDITLQALLKDRCMWRDTRFYFDHGFQTNVGGNRSVTTKKRWEQDLKLLKKKWGSYIAEVKSFANGCTMTRPIGIKRRWKVKV